MLGDLSLYLALATLLGFVAGWLAHGIARELWACMRYAIRCLQRLHAWTRARESRRLAALEYQMSHVYVDLS